MAGDNDNKTKQPPPPVSLGQVATILQSIAKPLGTVLTFLLPLLIKVSTFLYHLYQKLPQNALAFVVGTIFCFFGGLYPALFAAVEAAEHAGRQVVVNSLTDLAEEALIIIEESKKDDQVDDNKDGIPDVQQINGKEYTIRKTKLVLKKMNPAKVDNALSQLYQVWLAVAAVLTIQFARTIALALSISNFLKKPCDRFLTPLLTLVIPADYAKWVPVVLGWTIKSIAISIAWYIQTVISAFTSALRGGSIMAGAFYNFLLHRNITLGGWILKGDRERIFEEGFGYLFAALGFYFQFKMGFDVPFPWNLVLWPFEVAEYYIRWTITSEAKV